MRLSRPAPAKELTIDIRDDKDDIWSWDFGLQKLTRRITGPSTDGNPMWTPDGKWIVFSSERRGGITSPYRQRSDGTGDPEPLGGESPDARAPNSITPDGRFLVFRESASATRQDLMMLEFTTGKITPLLNSVADETNGEVSPDGKWLGYEFQESPGSERQIIVRSFPDMERHFVIGAGQHPAWATKAPDLLEIFYETPDGRFAARTFRTGSNAGPAEEEYLPIPAHYTAFAQRSYEVSPDGKYFYIIIQGVGQGGDMAAIENWTRVLKTAPQQ